MWEHSLDATLGVLRNGIETHLITSHFAIPLMLEGTRGLVIEVGDGKRDVPYRTNMSYDLVKTARESSTGSCSPSTRMPLPS